MTVCAVKLTIYLLIDTLHSIQCISTKYYNTNYILILFKEIIKK